MKTIIYSLIAIILFGIIASGFANKETNLLLIQSTDKNTSSELLTQSAEIISARLKSFGSDNYKISIVAEKNQIQVLFPKNWDIKVVEKLITQKGVFAFYETYNKTELTELLNGDKHLFSLLKNDDDKGADIGCTSASEIEKVNDYLSSTGLNQKCKFSWEQLSKDSEVCLFALIPDNLNGEIIRGSDIESIQSEEDKTSKTFYIEIQLKEAMEKAWADATKRNMNKAIAILLDDNVLSAPIVRSEINGGKCSISGDFTQTEVRYFAALGNNGVLPVSFKIVN